MDKRAVDSGQVGERAKEALVDGLDGLNGLSMMLVLGVGFFFPSWQNGMCLWEGRGGVSGEGS